MSNVTGSMKVTMSSTQTPTGLPGTVTPLTINQTFNSSFQNGTAADQVDTRYTNTLTFVASTPQVLDLTSLLDTSGNTISFARVRRLSIKFKDTTDGQTLVLGYGTTTANAWTSLISNPGTLTLQPSTAGNDGFIALSAPNTTGWVVGTSNKLLNLNPGTSAFSIDIEILGASA